MSKRTTEYCDCCGREVPLLGNRGQGLYRDVFTRTRWQFIHGRLSWMPVERVKVTVCGECWDEIGIRASNSQPSPDAS